MIDKVIILNTRDKHYLRQVVDIIEKKYSPKNIAITNLEDFNILKIRSQQFDLCVVPHTNWFGKDSIKLEICGYLLGAKKTIAYSVSLVEYEVNFSSIISNLLFDIYKGIFKLLKLYILLDWFYEQIILARRIKNESLVDLGENSAIRGLSQIDYYKNITIGNNSAINYGFQAIGRGKITIGDFVQIGPNVMISTANHNILGKNFDLYPVTLQNIKIEDNVWIGANSIILAGVTVGAGSIIGAGSVVRHRIPKNSIVMGNPAKVVAEKPE